MSDPFTEGAGAAKEIAKTAGKAIDAGRELGGWFEGKTGEALEHSIGWAFTDHIRRSRAIQEHRHRERLQVLALETQKRLMALGAEILREVPETTAVPLIEAAALEADPDLQILWANLLASALSGDEKDDLRNFVSILRELRAVDALALRDYRLRTADAVAAPFKEFGYAYPPGSLVGELYGLEVTRNLFRLGLVEPAPMVIKIVQNVQDGGYGRSVNVQDQEIQVPGDLYRIYLTGTADTFCDAIGLERPPQDEK